MNSVEYDSRLSATIPISDYHAVPKAIEAVRQDNFEDWLLSEEHLFVAEAYEVDPLSF